MDVEKSTVSDFGEKPPTKKQKQNYKTDAGENSITDSREKPTTIEEKQKRKINVEAKSRCNQKAIAEFMSGLKGHKRKILENSIFAPYFHIRKRQCKLSLVSFLISHYDIERQGFVFGKQLLNFCGKEVEEVLGIKFEGTSVSIDEDKGEKASSVDFITKHFGDAGNLRRENLLNYLNSMKVETDEDKQDFFKLAVTYIFNIYFFASADVCIVYKFCEQLRNRQHFDSLNWGKAVYDFMMNDVIKFAEVFRRENNFKQRFLKGCYPLLEVLMYRRLPRLRPKLVGQIKDLSFGPLPWIVLYESKDGRPFNQLLDLFQNIKGDEISACKYCPSKPSIEEPKMSSDLLNSSSSDMSILGSFFKNNLIMATLHSSFCSDLLPKGMECSTSGATLALELHGCSKPILERYFDEWRNLKMNKNKSYLVLGRRFIHNWEFCVL